MHDDEKSLLEHQSNIAAFEEAMKEKISRQNFEYDGERYVHNTVQLIFEAFVAGQNPDGLRIIGQQLYAEINPSSKYASQAEEMIQKNHIYPFPVCFVADPYGYVVRGGIGGWYRLDDVKLFFKVNGELHPIQ